MHQIENKHLKATLRVVQSFFYDHQKDLIILSLLSIVSAVGNATIPLIAGKMFDAILSPDIFTFANISLKFVWALLIIWIIVQIITSITDWKISIESIRMGLLAQADYSLNAFANLLLLPLSFHKTQKLTEIDSKINRAAYSINTIFGKVIIDLAPQVISITIAFIITLYINVFLSLVLIVGIIIYTSAAWYKIKNTAAIEDQGFDAWNDSFGYAGDMLQNIKAIKEAVAEGHERNNLSERFRNRLVSIWLALEEVWNNLRYYQRIVVLLCQIIIFLVSITLIMKGEMTIGELIAFNAYSALMFGPFVTLMSNWQTVRNGITNIGKTEEVIGITKENYEPHDKISINTIKGEVEFRNVSFSYDEGREVLSEINFKINPGKVTALVGESGVGKSTLIDMISGYHFPSSGEVLIDGYDIRKISLNKLRSSIAVVPQEVVLFNETIKHNIAYGNFDKNQEQLEEATRKAHAIDFIKKFPDTWEQQVGERGIKLSVGQKQRVAIARAILRDPKILILDEPTSALDAGSEKIITASLEELMRGKTTFIIAHRLSTVRKADKILVFKEGRIIEQGTHQELLQIENGEYRRLYELQIGLHE